MRKNILGVFEGMDAAGKSEVSRLVAKELGAEYLETPLPEFQEVRRYVDSHAPEIGKFLFYISTNLDASEYLRERIKETSIISARYFHTSFIDFSTRFNLTLEEAWDLVPVNPSDFFQPDITILLCVSPEVQRQRLIDRNRGNHTATDLLCLTQTEYRNEINDKYLKCAETLDWPKIDTSYNTTEQTVQECVTLFEKLK
tara:strand:+ start:1416 stop:2012 length:597 start_codon:yes stop_codon:yes gene_type:complete